MAQATAEPAIKAYWQPGCTSCLRMKEFLTRHGVPFVSVNVLADKAAFAELAELGIRSVPIVRRGKDWANGQVLKDVARVAGIEWGGAKMLPVPELVSRLVTIQQAAQRLFAQIPDAKLGQMRYPGVSKPVLDRTVLREAHCRPLQKIQGTVHGTDPADFTKLVLLPLQPQVML